MQGSTSAKDRNELIACDRYIRAPVANAFNWKPWCSWSIWTPDSLIIDQCVDGQGIIRQTSRIGIDEAAHAAGPEDSLNDNFETKTFEVAISSGKLVDVCIGQGEA